MLLRRQKVLGVVKYGDNWNNRAIKYLRHRYGTKSFRSHREHLFHESSFCYSRSSARRSTVRISGTTKRSKSSVSRSKVCERREIVIVVSPAMSCQFYGLKFEINCTGIRLVVARCVVGSAVEEEDSVESFSRFDSCRRKISCSLVCAFIILLVSESHLWRM